MKRTKIIALLSAGIAVAALAVTATSASAMPIRGVETGNEGDMSYVAARAYSPPNAGCGAYGAIRIRNMSGAVVRQWGGRFNACRYSAGSGWTYGYVVRGFALLPRGQYVVQVAAGQSRTQGFYAHGLTRIRNF
jgi:hypothetical protein